MLVLGCLLWFVLMVVFVVWLLFGLDVVLGVGLFCLWLYVLFSVLLVVAVYVFEWLVFWVYCLVIWVAVVCCFGVICLFVGLFVFDLELIGLIVIV